MERYEVIKEVGNGTFGSVWRALNKQSGEVVAIKKMKKKYYSWEECVNLREVKSLRKMNHPNIVKLKEVIRESDVLYFVFEYMECNLYQIMKDRGRVFSEAEVKNWCFQVFQGLAYIHQHGYFHRDLKPENLLLSRDVLKIADFGLAREINAQPPFTDYVSTRWYRAPEVLLQSPAYGHPVDIWAMGAIMAELFTLRPLFPGSRILGLLVYKAYSYTTLSELKSMQRLKFTLHEADEIYKICCVIGSPSKSEWTQGLELASAINYQFPRVAGVHLSSLVPGVSEDAINLIKSLCSWNPCKRPTALEALQHPFFKSCFYVPPSLRSKPAIARTPAGTRGVLEQNCGMRNTGSLSNPKLAHSSSEKQQEYMVAGVQRKLEMNNQDSTKNDRNLKNYAKPQPRYRPPGINGPSDGNMAKTHGVAEAAEKFANMTVGSGRPPSKLSGPPPMKAGGWHRPSDLFLERSQEAIPGRAAAYHRKVAG